MSIAHYDAPRRRPPRRMKPSKVHPERIGDRYQRFLLDFIAPWRQLVLETLEPHLAPRLGRRTFHVKHDALDPLDPTVSALLAYLQGKLVASLDDEALQLNLLDI